MKAKSLYLVFYLIISSCSTREDKNAKDQTYYRVEALKGTSNNSVFKNQFGDKFIWSRYFIQKKLSRCFFVTLR